MLGLGKSKNMKPIHYIILTDLALLAVCLKYIFGDVSLFFKTLVVHFFSDEYYEPAVFKRWEKRYDTHHKMNLLYAATLILAVANYLLYILVLAPNFPSGPN